MSKEETTIEMTDMGQNAEETETIDARRQSSEIIALATTLKNNTKSSDERKKADDEKRKAKARREIEEGDDAVDPPTKKCCSKDAGASNGEEEKDSKFDADELKQELKMTQHIMPFHELADRVVAGCIEATWAIPSWT